MNFKNKKEIFKIFSCFVLLFIAARLIIDSPLDKNIIHSPFFYFSGPEGSLILKLHIKMAKATNHFVYLIGVACGEEVVFRGPLLLLILGSAIFGEKIVSYLVIIYSLLSSYWFAILHFPILVVGQKITLAPYIFYFLFSIFLCWVVVRSKKLEPSIFLHFLWNFLNVF